MSHEITNTDYTGGWGTLKAKLLTHAALGCSDAAAALERMDEQNTMDEVADEQAAH